MMYRFYYLWPLCVIAFLGFVEVVLHGHTDIIRFYVYVPVFFIFAFVQYSFWRKDRDRLNQLQAVFRAMEQGDFRARLPEVGDPTYQSLLEAFDEMRRTVQMACNELECTAERAEAANVAKSDFLANMSHELRTPMNGVVGMVEILMDTNLTTEQKDYVLRIRRSAENLLTIMNDILDFSKIEAHSLELEDIPYSPREICQEVVDMLLPLANKKEIYLRLDVAEGVPTYAKGDPGRVRQILVNLLGNAVKFTPAGGVSLTVTLRNHVGGAPVINYSVKDTGVGIDARNLDHIFNKFTQADASMSRKFGGTGLGLAITHKLVEMMLGEISVESELGRGSEFVFFLPHVEPTAEELAEAEQLKRAHQEKLSDGADASVARIPVESLSVLVVEDDPVNQEVITRFLQKLGVMQVDVATDGQEGLGMYDPDIYNFVLMDCQMPIMDGFEASRLIRQHEEDTGAHIPIIACTANAMVGDRERCLAAGMDCYLSKPVSLKALKKTMSQFVLFPETSSSHSQQEEHPVHAEVDAPIDLHHLDSYTDGNLQEERELIDLFFATFTPCLEDLKTLVSAGEEEEWRKMAHRMKGASGNAGAVRLSALCKQAEQGQEEGASQKEERAEAIAEELQKVRDFMAARHHVSPEDAGW